MFENKYETDNMPWEIEENEKRRKAKPERLRSPLLYVGVVVFLLIALVFISLTALISTETSDEHVPQVTSIEQLDSYPISNCEIEEGVMKANYVDRLETDFSGIGYKYKVTLDNGKEIILSPGSRNYDIGSSAAFLELNGYIWTNDLGEIIRSGDSTVDVTVSAKIRNTKSKYSNIISETEATFEKEIVDRIVSDIRYVGNTPVTAYSDCDHLFIDAGEFEITYGDSKKVVAKPEINEKGNGQTLDGHVLETWATDDNEDGIDDGVGVGILDCYSDDIINLTEKPYPFSKIELTDCSFDENLEITSISYTVTYKDGSVVDYNNQKPLADSERNWVFRYDDDFGFPYIHGYYVIAEPQLFFSENDSDSGKNTAINIKLSLGFISEESIEDNKVFPLPESDCNCICHNNSKTAKSCYDKLLTIAEFFPIKEHCKCGIYHYDVADL